MNLKKYFILTAIFLIEIAIWAETDIFLPSMPEMIKYFHINEHKIQLVLNINLIGLFISAIFAGPISDLYGRRRVVLIGMSIFSIASYLCVTIDSFNFFLVTRLIQGIGAGIPMVVAWVILIDKYSEEEFIKISGWVNGLVVGVMAGAPIVGSFLNDKFGWKSNFLAISILASIATIFTYMLEESYEAKNNKKLSILNVINDYVFFIKNKYFISNVLIVSLSYSCIMIYMFNLPVIFINHIGVSVRDFGYLQSSTMITYMIASMMSTKLIEKYGKNNTKLIVSITAIIGSILLFLVSIFCRNSVIMICLTMNIFAAGVSIASNIFYINAMNSIDNLKGTASGIFTISRLIVISIINQLSSLFFNGTILPVSAIIIIITLLIVTIYLKMMNKENHI